MLIGVSCFCLIDVIFICIEILADNSIHFLKFSLIEGIWSYMVNKYIFYDANIMLMLILVIQMIEHGYLKPNRL